MKTRSDAFQFEKELDWEKPAPGIRRQIMGYDGQLMMVKVEFEKGAVGSMHQHYHSQATCVAGPFGVLPHCQSFFTCRSVKTASPASQPVKGSIPMVHPCGQP